MCQSHTHVHAHDKQYKVYVPAVCPYSLTCSISFPEGLRSSCNEREREREREGGRERGGVRERGGERERGGGRERERYKTCQILVH